MDAVCYLLQDDSMYIATVKNFSLSKNKIAMACVCDFTIACKFGGAMGG